MSPTEAGEMFESRDGVIEQAPPRAVRVIAARPICQSRRRLGKPHALECAAKDSFKFVPPLRGRLYVGMRTLGSAPRIATSCERAQLVDTDVMTWVKFVKCLDQARRPGAWSMRSEAERAVKIPKYDAPARHQQLTPSRGIRQGPRQRGVIRSFHDRTAR